MGSISLLFSWRGAILQAGELSSSAKLVAHTLSCYMSEAGDSAFPSISTLATGANLAESTVKVHLRQLLESGYLKKVRQGGSYAGGARVSNSYLATIPTPGREPTGPDTGSVPGRENGATRAATGQYHVTTTKRIAAGRTIIDGAEYHFSNGSGWIPVLSNGKGTDET